MSDNGEGGWLAIESDGTKHLPTTRNGKPDHGLMGAAWAALHGGYRGNKYEGPHKEAAIAKLRKLYQEEDMATPDSSRQDSGAFLATAPADWMPEIDLERRVLRNAVFGTTGLATDGRIILPKGIDFATYLTNPIITCRHTINPDGKSADDAGPIVIARTLRMHADDYELRGDEVQFADNELGRQYAYLYGVNPDHEAYMRMWSIEAYRLESNQATFDQARRIAGSYWDANVAARIQTAQKTVPVWSKTVLTAVAAATLGADRSALTRAMKAGVALAGELVARMDLAEAQSGISDFRFQITEMDGRIARLEMQIQALGRDGASAAARGDSEALLKELRELTKREEQQ